MLILLLDIYQFINRKPSIREKYLTYIFEHIHLYILFIYKTLKYYQKIQDGKVNKTLIEGPVPVCDQVFENTKSCLGYNTSIQHDGNLVPFRFHGERVSFYQPLQEFLSSTLSPFLSMKTDYLAFVEKRIAVTLDEESEMGNLMNNVLMKTTKADFSFLSLGNSILYTSII